MPAFHVDQAGAVPVSGPQQAPHFCATIIINGLQQLETRMGARSPRFPVGEMWLKVGEMWLWKIGGSPVEAPKKVGELWFLAGAAPASRKVATAPMFRKRVPQAAAGR